MSLELRFDSVNHKYTLVDENGLEQKTLQSVTQLMQKHGLSANYDDVDPDILERAAEFGNICHSFLEKYFKGEMQFSEVIPLVQDGIRVLEANGFVPISSEKQVHDDNVAGTIDMVAMKEEDLALLDFKYTYNFNHYAVTWQLSIYRYLLMKSTGMEANKLYCLWYNKPKEKYELRYIKPIDFKFIENLLTDDKEGKIYTESQYNIMSVIEKQLKIDQEMMKFIQLDEYAKTQKANIDILKQELHDEMEKYNIRNYETSNFKITRVMASTSTTYDTKELIKNLGEDFDLTPYEKETEKKGYIKITRKEENK